MHSAIPSARFGIASFGELVSDPSRVSMLLSLMDGLARPASELAGIAGVVPSTASAHLSRLLAGGLVLAEQHGRHRYFRLADEHVADALEAIALQATPAPATHRAPLDPARTALAKARTCYRHLAGQLGVSWLSALEKNKFLQIRDGSLVLAPRGISRFEELGLTVEKMPAGKPCLDWTERRNHLGGALGALLTDHLFTICWLERKRERRALRVTTRGLAGFKRFGIAVAS